MRGGSRTSRCCSPRAISSPSSPGGRSRESPRRSRSSWRQGRSAVRDRPRGRARRRCGTPWTRSGSRTCGGPRVPGVRLLGAHFAGLDAGRPIPRTSQEQWAQLPHIPLNDLRPGNPGGSTSPRPPMSPCTWGTAWSYRPQTGNRRQGLPHRRQPAARSRPPGPGRKAPAALHTTKSRVPLGRAPEGRGEPRDQPRTPRARRGQVRPPSRKPRYASVFSG